MRAIRPVRRLWPSRAAPRTWGSIDDTAKRELPSVMGPPTSSTRFPCMSGHKARTWQDCPGAGARGRGVHAGSGVGFWSGAEDRLVRRSDRKSLARRTRRSSAESKPFRFRSRPCPPVSGKVRFTSAAGHLPSVRGRLAGRLHDAWSNPVPECPSELRARTRQRASATRQLTTSSGTASRGTSVDGSPLKRRNPLLPSSSQAADPVKPC